MLVRRTERFTGVIQLINDVIVARGEDIPWGIYSIDLHTRRSLKINLLFFVNTCTYSVCKECLWAGANNVSRRADPEIMTSIMEELEEVEKCSQKSWLQTKLF